MKEYKFYGANNANCKPLSNEYSVKDPKDLYDVLNYVWSKETCAPRMQDRWSIDNKTLGQCSITAFLVQDIFGGIVYGVPLGDGNFHCYNVIGNNKFDLTSEQFGNIVLDYSDKYIQTREEHFKKEEKYQRYLLLKQNLKKQLEKK